MLKEKITSIIAILLLLTLVGLSYWYSVKADLEGMGHLSDINSPDFVAHDIVVTKFDKDGVASGKVFAKFAEHFSDGHANATLPEYYSLDPAKAQITARSDTGEMTVGGEVFHFYGNVDLRQAADAKNPASRLETSQLDAFPDDDVYSSDKPVKLTRGEDVSYGLGMDYDNVERTFKLRSKVHSIFQPRSTDELTGHKESPKPAQPTGGEK